MSGLQEEAQIKAKTILYSNTSAPSYTDYYMDPGQWRAVPVKAESTGIMYMDTIIRDGGSSGCVTAFLCDSYYIEENKINYNYFDQHYMYYGDSKKGTSGMPVKAGKIYYILLNLSQYADSPFEIGVRAKVYTTINRNLSAGTSKWTVVSGLNRSGDYSTTKFKITPSKTGVIAVELKEYGYNSSSAKIRLYNKSGKAVSNTVNYYSSDGKAYFGVKKGYTYYLKVSSCSGSYDNNYKYGIRYSITERSNRSLGSKSNARTLQRKADYTNTLFIANGSSDTDWYKFKVTSKRKTCIKINTSRISSGELYVYIYTKNGKQIGSKQTIKAWSNGGEYTLTYGTTYGKANAGTYYVKVVKSKNASGHYRIKYSY